MAESVDYTLPLLKLHHLIITHLIRILFFKVINYLMNNDSPKSIIIFLKIISHERNNHQNYNEPFLFVIQS